MYGCYNYFNRDETPDSSAGSSWFTKARLNGGSQWESKYERANVAFDFITALALLGICIWSFTVQKRTVGARSLFSWFLPAVVIAFIYQIWVAINLVLVEQCARVEQLYIIFDDILLSLFSLADALLLATIFTYLIPLTPFARNNTVGRRAMSPPLMMHLGFCGLLSLFWIIIMCVSLAFSIQGVLSTGDYQLDTLNALWKLQLVYDILYLIAALEVLALSAAVLSSPKGHDRKTPLLFLLLVSLPLFIRQLWVLALEIVNNLGYFERLPSRQVAFASNMFHYLCTIAIYAGLVLMIKSIYPAGDNFEGTGMVNHPVITEPVPRIAGGTASNWDKQSTRDHSQDPIYDGPGPMRDV